MYEGVRRWAAWMGGVTSTEEAQGILADQFVDYATTDLDNKVGPSTTACRGFLAAIAGFLADHRTPDTVTFRFEDLTSPHPSWRHRYTVGLRGALTTGLLAGLSLGLTMGLLFGLGLGVGLTGGLTVGLTLGLAAALCFALYGGLLFALGSDGRPKRSRLRWSDAPRAAAWLGLGPAVGLLAGSKLGALMMGLFFALLGGVLATRLIERDVVTAGEVDEGRIASRASLAMHTAAFGVPIGLLSGALVTGLLVELGDELLFGLSIGLPFGLNTGFLFGLAFGLFVERDAGVWYLMLQRDVRRRAYRQGLLSKDPVEFVRAAVEVGILRETGGGVQFRHHEIADRLASEAPIPGLADLRAH